ncbi:hypothetical protein GCM10011390_13470 [Aureimonas endophytica]|uniref:NmrA-like domain-containing protein n=1 Tax=Aureimonas endophytica TaxID=2027858 RepID=A0A916ZHA2_9HYPH|nr:NmrA family NAD(P)-binding protein [Aureimonas endophytica]GGD96020.1 hypothetical protein GCM10011390_13470 [Aureimonas endophytica]
MSLLVIPAAGVQGGAVVRAALRRGRKVRALVRDPARAAPLAALGAELARGDLLDPASLRAASLGIRHVVLQVLTGPVEAMRAMAANALDAFAAAGVAGLVLKLASASRTAPCAEPSLVANAMVEAMVRAAGLPAATVRPTLYLDNLLKDSARRDIVENGLFAPPIAADQRIAWTSAEDCAEAALVLLERGAFGGDHRIAGPAGVTGPELAARLSVGLGRRVHYRAQPVEDFEREVAAAMGPALAAAVASKFRFFAALPEEAEAILAAPFAPQPGLEDFRPTAIADWTFAHRADFMPEEAIA